MIKYVRVKGVGSKSFISDGRHGCFISPWLFSGRMNGVKELKMRVGRMGEIFRRGERMKITWLVVCR